ncbi:MAG: Ig-like domain-containing protein [Clostridiaceae bacterium]|nr:Ig-like domain-containing protein [Clostridiaceae bacterium]
MKFSNLTKRTFACGLAMAMVVTGIGITPDNTVKAASKKASVSKSMSITVGKTKKLTVKNANKKVKWSTSNKKVAKVTKSTGKKKNVATIKGVKAGTATITAKVGKQKLKCKVTVKKAVPVMKSVAVDQYDSTCVVLTLKSKFTLNVSDFTVTSKEYNEGSYNNTCSIRTMTSEDQKTYRLYLAESVSNGDYVKVAAQGVSKEAQYKKTFMTASENQTQQLICKNGATVVLYCSDYFTNGIGTKKYSVSGTLPSGLSFDSTRNVITGVLGAVGETTVKIKATDELKRTATAELQFKVYDDSAIVGKNVTADYTLTEELEQEAVLATEANKNLTDDEKLYRSKITLSASGGSENYIYTLATPDNEEVRLSTDVTDSTTKQVTQEAAASTSLCVPYSLTAGTHTYTVTATDAMDASKTCTITVTVNVEKSYNLTGTARDAKSRELSGNTIYFIPSDARSLSDAVTTTVGTGSNGNAPGEAKGSYAVSLPSGKYTVKIYGDGILYHMKKTITIGTKDTTAAVKAPSCYYTVTGTATYANTENKLDTEYIYFEMQDYQYEGASFYAETDENGKFMVSLPSNTYAAYIYDEYGNRQYLNKKIKVGKSDVSAGTLKTSISRYYVQGLAYNATSVDALTGSVSSLQDTTLYFYNTSGKVVSVTTDSKGMYKVYLQGSSTGETYKVRAVFGDTLRTLGTVTVTDANQSSTSLNYTFANDLADGTQDITADTTLTLNSSGNNDLVAKFVPSESGNYELTVANGAEYAMYVAVLDENGIALSSTTTDSDVTSETLSVSNLEQGKTYYVKATPVSGKEQVSCAVTLLIQKKKTPQELATSITVGSAQSVTTVAGETKFIKVAMEAGTTYAFSVSNMDDDIYECYFQNYGTEGESYSYPSGYVYSSSDSYTITPSISGDYYIRVRYYDYYYDEISATAEISVRVQTTDSDED